MSCFDRDYDAYDESCWNEVVSGNPYEAYTGDEDNTAEDTDDQCARCARAYEPSNIPNMLRCPGCGEYVEVIEAEDDGGAWDRSSRHRTRLDLEPDDE